MRRAVFGPIGKDGYFDPLYDKKTGIINKEVAAYWKAHYDLRYYLETNWTTVGPRLIAQFIARKKPEGATTPWWTY